MRLRNKNYILLLLVFGVLCLAMLIIERTTGQRVLTMICRMDLYDFLFIFLCLVGIGVISLLIRLWRRSVRKLPKVLIVFGWVLIIGMIMFGSLIWLGDYATTTWYEFKSPDKKYSLVAREYTFLLLSDIRLYERTSPIFVRELEADLSPDDGLAAISQDAYKISWDGDVVTLSVDMNQNGMWDTVKLNMAEHGKVLEKFINYPNGKPAGWIVRVTQIKMMNWFHHQITLNRKMCIRKK